MKFICEECEKPCILDTGDYPGLKVAGLRCIVKNSDYCKWEKYEDGEVATNLQPTCNQLATDLPKLTAEVFDRPDCPEWAQWAAVDKDGKGFYYQNKPKKNGYKQWSLLGVGDYRYIGIFDASDWQNSLVERPAKALPDWCRVGEWVYLCNGTYSRIVSINDCHVNLENGISVGKNSIHEEMVSARLRPYNAEEIPDLPFEVSERNSNFRTTVVSCAGDNVWLGGASTAISVEELMRDFTSKGSPCGVLEHFMDGEWGR